MNKKIEYFKKCTYLTERIEQSHVKTLNGNKVFIFMSFSYFLPKNKNVLLLIKY